MTNIGNYITVNMLKYQNPSLPNRGIDGHPKTTLVGGVTRAKISSQCIKRAIRGFDNNRAMRSGHFEDLVESVLQNKMNENVFSADDTIPVKGKDETKLVFDALGEEICDFLGANWKKRSSVKKTSKKTSTGDGEQEEEKGRTILCCSPEEIQIVIDSVLQNYKELGKEKYFNEKNHEKVKKEIVNKLKEAELANDVALYGRMTTSSIIETVIGASRFSDAYSVDRYNGDEDYWTAVEDFGNYDIETPFYKKAQEFANERTKATGAVCMDRMTTYSNLMYSNAAFHIDSLVRLTSKERAKNLLVDVVEKYAIASPSGMEASHFSNLAPTLLYIEVIRDGLPRPLCFDKVIERKNNSSIAEQAILRIKEHFSSDTFSKGIISKYVLIDSAYNYLEEKFKNVGIIPVNSLEELNKILSEEIDDIEKNL